MLPFHISIMKVFLMFSGGVLKIIKFKAYGTCYCEMMKEVDVQKKKRPSKVLYKKRVPKNFANLLKNFANAVDNRTLCYIYDCSILR